MKKILTVLIPVYNTEKYIKRCLDSLIDESIIDNIEILIVSDGSKDNSILIAKDYEKKYPNSIKIIEKENGGHGSTINKGLEIATGKYFRVLDSDDWFNTSDFVKLVNYIKNDSNNLINPETGMQTRGMEETDLQIITRSATLEVKKQTDRIIEEMRENISKELVSAFTSEAEKIAKVAIEAMGQTKLVIDKNLKNMENEIVDLKKENQIQNQEIERLYSNQATNLKKQLEDRQKKIEQLERENQELKNKSLFNRIFKR